MRRIVFLLFGLGGSILPMRADDAPVNSELKSAAFSIRGGEPAGRLEVAHSGQVICVYSFSSNQFKPYVKELRTLAGEYVLLDSPPDHLHHHGLMYAVRINGINFWEETEPAGREEHVAITDKSIGADDASFSELVHWFGPGGRSHPLLTEMRKITLKTDESQKEVALYWKSSFRVGEQPVKLTGTAYNGLGMRFPPAWNGTAAHSNSEDLPYTAEHNWDVTAARWAALYHSGSDFKSTVALFGQSNNPGETRFFSMNNPFAYLSVTQNLEQHPIEYAPGAKFDLNYLVLLYSEAKKASFLNARYERWLTERTAR